MQGFDASKVAPVTPSESTMQCGGMAANARAGVYDLVPTVGSIHKLLENNGLHGSTWMSELAGIPQPWAAVVVSLTFTGIARWLHGVSRWGAVAGAVICFVIYATAGPRAVGTLAIVFALTWASTRFGYARKKRLGTAEKGQGRSASQVLANLSVAAGCSLLTAASGRAVFLLGTVAALSEAAADTVSSEIGQARSEASLMITTWQAVPAGTSGGVTGIGTVVGLMAAALVSLFSAWVGLLPGRWLVISIVAAALGMIADSLLGATMEQKEILDNNWVNFLSTLLAAVVAMALA